MDYRAGTLAATRRYEKVFFAFFLSKADLALTRQVFVDLVDLLLVGIGLSVRESLLGCFELRDNVFDATELDHVADFWVIYLVPNG